MFNSYGREDIVEILSKRANALSNGYRQNIVIVGEEFIGKTNLIQHWLSRYCHSLVVPIYIEVIVEEPIAFSRKMIGTLLYKFLQNGQFSLKEDIDFLLDKSQRYIPNTVRLAKEILFDQKKRRSHDYFTRLLELFESFYSETGKHCLVVLDEFHRLGETKFKDAYLQLRKQIMLQKNTMYILLSSEKNLADKILASDLNLLFGNFEKIELEPLQNKAAQSFVKSRLGSLAVDIPISDFIVDFSCAKPFYLDVISSAFRDYSVRNGSTANGINSFISSLEDLFLGKWGIINKRFYDLTEKIERSVKHPQTLEVLIRLAAGSSRLSQLAAQLRKTQKEISQLLSRLIEQGILSKATDIYVFEDRLFSFWLSHIYCMRLNAFGIDSDRQRSLFREAIERNFRNFSEAQKKAIPERIVDLFNQFGNEAVHIKDRRLRLNHFKEVKLLNLGGSKIRQGILGRAVNSLWIAGLKEDSVDEEDMFEFVAICQKFKYDKTQKRIFISFDEVDNNARLIAKEEKIATWDAVFLNRLLDIYGKPRIIK